MDLDLDTQVCERCGEEKHLRSFSRYPKPNGEGYYIARVCGTCRKKEYFNHPDLGRERRQRAARTSKNINWIKLCGFDPDKDYARMFRKQKGRCKICRKTQKRRLCIDHCHKTNRVRGLLCSNCNTALGLLGDDHKRLRRAARYLEAASL